MLPVIATLFALLPLGLCAPSSVAQSVRPGVNNKIIRNLPADHPVFAELAARDSLDARDTQGCHTNDVPAPVPADCQGVIDLIKNDPLGDIILKAGQNAFYISNTCRAMVVNPTTPEVTLTLEGFVADLTNNIYNPCIANGQRGYYTNSLIQMEMYNANGNWINL